MKRSLVLFLLLCLIPVNLPSFAAADAPAHPRYIYSASDVGRVRALSDSYASTIINNFINSANSVLSSSPVPQSFVGIRMDCTQGGRALELAYAYLLTGNADYAGGALQEAEYACSYPSWNHRDHFLDTSSMATCVAAVYDWCYDTLTNENKTYLESKIRAYFTEPALEVYNGTADFPSSQWHVNTKNWNTVCNSAVISVACIFYERDPQYYENLISKARASLDCSLPMYAPDGGYEEGTGYWNYATSGLVDAIETLELAFGNDRGLYASEGFSETGSYTVYMEGEKTFTYGDGYDQSFIGATNYYFAKRQISAWSRDTKKAV